MPKTTRQSKRIFLSILGTAIAVPLVAIPASAALDGNFLIHAQNTEDRQYEATAGMRNGAAADPGTGPVEEAENSTVLASYKCGPMSFDVTQGMVDFTKANQELLAAGKPAKTHAGGWQSLSYTASNGGPAILGFPDDKSKTIYAKLSPTMTAPEGDGSNGVTAVAMERGGSSGCDILDARTAPQAGAQFRYSNNGTTVKDGRYLAEDGKLVAGVAQSYYGSDSGFYRYASAGSTNPFVSATKPYYVVDRGSQSQIDVKMPTTVDGYNTVSLVKYSDGSTQYSYKLNNNSARANGPSYLKRDAGNQITMAQGYTVSGQYISLNQTGNPYSVADWNAASGHTWNGAEADLSGFDTAVPFKAVVR